VLMSSRQNQNHGPLPIRPVCERALPAGRVGWSTAGARARLNATSGDQSFTKLSSKSVAAPQLRSECADKTRLQSAAAQNSVVIMDSLMREEWYSTVGSASDRSHLDNMPADTSRNNGSMMLAGGHMEGGGTDTPVNSTCVQYCA